MMWMLKTPDVTALSMVQKYYWQVTTVIWDRVADRDYEIRHILRVIGRGRTCWAYLPHLTKRCPADPEEATYEIARDMYIRHPASMVTRSRASITR